MDMLHPMVILRSQNKITDFLMILAWVWAFYVAYMLGSECLSLLDF